ncbi:MAG: ATP-binding protein [Roseiflexaceae bacterium]
MCVAWPISSPIMPQQIATIAALAKPKSRFRSARQGRSGGIPAEDIPHLFERFYRAGNTDAQHISGMGIGLYIVKEIVSLHGGSVGVESTEGSGSAFTVYLPFKTDISETV